MNGSPTPIVKKFQVVNGRRLAYVDVGTGQGTEAGLAVANLSLS